MSGRNEELKLVIDLIDRIYSDTSVPQEKMLKLMEEISSHVKSKVDVLRRDLWINF